jgi:hypothetical protein
MPLRRIFNIAASHSARQRSRTLASRSSVNAAIDLYL